MSSQVIGRFGVACAPNGTAAARVATSEACRTARYVREDVGMAKLVKGRRSVDVLGRGPTLGARLDALEEREHDVVELFGMFEVTHVADALEHHLLGAG